MPFGLFIHTYTRLSLAARSAYAYVGADLPLPFTLPEVSCPHDVYANFVPRQAIQNSLTTVFVARLPRRLIILLRNTDLSSFDALDSGNDASNKAASNHSFERRC